ncbi:hypothetical protein O181_003496 [Austropuccinia psidii MF-1]|uniref:Uncharacterized protein n=1 Tax=Austropuccinia psidii MF-1 TaxID=1389203 RepID=A0A9Q3GE75_9BASI|nr:hypothetical protein [Austropuccinia psidii MF-1]
MFNRRIDQCTRGNFNNDQNRKNMEKLDIKSSSKQFVKEEKLKEPLKPNNTNEQRKFHKFGIIGCLANNFIKKAKINEIVETEYHNDKEEESDSEETEEESDSEETEEEESDSEETEEEESDSEEDIEEEESDYKEDAEEEESDFEEDTEESETSQIDEINIINSQINNI